MAPVGAKFRAALARLPAATEATELLTDAPTPDEIEDQLQRANGASSPGLDGVGYDTYKLFNTQLLPVLHAAFQCCWRHQRVPQSWKQGTVRLIYKKGSREDPANWRPICLQQVIYKTGPKGVQGCQWLRRAQFSRVDADRPCPPKPQRAPHGLV
ncbi:hypothetical protein PC118_g25826 [Phytophthora cactorum]|uniref:Reverse transcriptase domain-containing protein n=1 Tax=Phytophthora cactorum TaxID=29920 RepID=A0A8T1DSH1_9STRA|nr:hypothetical protein PC118_g25826 [Phytophthora cactorum]